MFKAILLGMVVGVLCIAAGVFAGYAREHRQPVAPIETPKTTDQQRLVITGTVTIETVK